MAESELLVKPVEKTLKLSTEETQYQGAILTRLVTAKVERDGKILEFNNKAYLDNYIENERIANTFLDRKQMNDGIIVASGTVEQKLYTVAAEINRLNLSPEVRVFDKENNEYQKLALALTDTIFKTEEIEEDEENKLMRQVEMMKQGHVFIQDNWVCEYKKEKKVNNKFVGKIGGVDWTEKMTKLFDGPRRSILYGPGVYLGNIREFDVKKQPFIFTIKVNSYEETKARYGAQDKDGNYLWERWEYVPRKRVEMVPDATSVGKINFGLGYSLSALQQDQVEEIHYQDQYNDEYQIFLNGIAMLPVGFPLSALSAGGKFNITKQVFQAYNPFFAYGRSFCARVREQSDLLDEILRLLILKTRKSIHPPYANISGKVISAKSLMPGVISMGIDPGALVPIGTEGQGVTSSEYQMYNTLSEAIDKVTVSPQIQGQQGKSGTTAYEVSLLQKQAEKVISLFVFSASLLEQKVARLRLDLILWKYYDPIDTRLDESLGQIRNIYRKTTRRASIEGRGNGIRQIIPTDQDVLPTSDEIADYEDYYDTPQPEGNNRPRTREELGMEPLEIIYLSLPGLRQLDLVFYIEIDSRDKDTSTNAKLMFRQELQDVQALMSMGSQPDVSELENTYAQVWGRRKEKLFKTASPEMAGAIPEGANKVLNNNNQPLPTPA